MAYSEIKGDFYLVQRNDCFVCPAGAGASTGGQV